MIEFKVFSCVLFVLLLSSFVRVERAVGANRQGQQQQQQQGTQYLVRPNAPPAAHPNSTRSYRCLVEQVARKNHINATYTKISAKGTPHQPVFTYRLHLGRESYVASNNSIKGAKEKVAREAYSATHYTKPKLHDRTCRNYRSDISEMNEWAQKKGYQFACAITDQKLETPIIYTYQCRILGTDYRAKANNSNKKQAQAAAIRDIKQQIERNPITLRGDQGHKYNATNYFYLNPISRLGQIQTARHQVDPVYRLIEEIRGISNKTHNEPTVFIMGVKSKQNADLEFTGVGRGATLKEAKYAAAVNVLNMMNYFVPQNITEYHKKGQH